MLEEILALVDPAVRHRSGSVLYSGRSAFEHPSSVYLLGLNPGGNPVSQADETIERDIKDSLTVNPSEWSAYADEFWRGMTPGTCGLQPRVLHMFKQLGLDPRRVPASNVVFVRSSRESDLGSEKSALLASCWPMHEAVIEQLGVRVILCMGGTAGQWVRETTGAHMPAGKFVENNARKWTSTAHRTAAGLHVLTLTHPSIAAWNSAGADPTPLVKSVLDSVNVP